jgi:hypothetical protein
MFPEPPPKFTHRDLAALVAALYDPLDKTAWLYRANPDANAVFGIVRRDGYLIVVYRGSYTGLDWLHDVLVADIDPIGRPAIRRVHRGFYSGTPEAWDLLAFIGQPDERIIFIGHSLGGARAELGAEHMLAVLGRAPHLVVTWGQPAVFKANAMPALAYPLVAYRNVVGGDEDEVTYATDIVGYRHRAPFVDVSAPPTSGGLLDLHHFALYQSVTPATEV